MESLENAKIEECFPGDLKFTMEFENSQDQDWLWRTFKYLVSLMFLAVFSSHANMAQFTALANLRPIATEGGGRRVSLLSMSCLSAWSLATLLFHFLVLI